MTSSAEFRNRISWKVTSMYTYCFFILIEMTETRLEERRIFLFFCVQWALLPLLMWLPDKWLHSQKYGWHWAVHILVSYNTTLLSNRCWGSGSRIRDPVPFWPRFRGSWIQNRFFSGSRISDPGSQTHIFESLVTIFWVKNSIILWKLAQIVFFSILKIK